jgi:hypothetical protein
MQDSFALDHAGDRHIRIVAKHPYRPGRPPLRMGVPDGWRVSCSDNANVLAFAKEQLAKRSIAKVRSVL